MPAPVPDAGNEHCEDGREEDHLGEALKGGLSFARDFLAVPLPPSAYPELDRTVQVAADILRECHVPSAARTR